MNQDNCGKNKANPHTSTEPSLIDHCYCSNNFNSRKKYFKEHQKHIQSIENIIDDLERMLSKLRATREALK